MLQCVLPLNDKASKEGIGKHIDSLVLLAIELRETEKSLPREQYHVPNVVHKYHHYTNVVISAGSEQYRKEINAYVQ